MGAKKWEDTVMRPKQVLSLLEKSNRYYHKYLKDNPPKDEVGKLLINVTRRVLQAHTVAQAQAEISFKAGQADGALRAIDHAVPEAMKAGRKEVVEWVSEYLEKCHRLIGENRVLITQDDFGIWRAKLKEWEVE